MKKNLLILLVFIASSVALNAQKFVKPGGSDTADGKTWETAWATLKHALDNVYSDEPIYFAAGTYSHSSGAVTSEAINSSVQLRTNYIIRGGFPTTLTGTSTSNYDPSTNITKFTGTAILNFRENTGNLDMQGIHFIDIAGGGGAISGPIFTANDTHFKTYKFRDLYVKGCTGSNLGNQGLFKLDDVANATISFDNCVFEGNRMPSLSITGGGSERINVYVRESYFKDNNTALEGGVIAIRSGHYKHVKTYIENNKFCNNRSGLHGGVIYAENTEVFLTNNKFYENFVKTTTNNGGVAWLGASRLVSSGNLYVGNHINSQINSKGGVFRLEGNHPLFAIDYSFDNDKFHNNKSSSSTPLLSANNYGGAISIITGGAKSTEVKNSEFVNNQAGRGGAIHADGTDLYVFNTNFQGNEAISSEALSQRGQGGAIRMYEAALHVVNSCFNGNKAKFEGGAIAFDDITTGQPVYGANFRQRIENCKFYANTVDNGSGGGALNFFEVRNGVSIKDSDFFNNEHLNAAWNIGLTNGGGAIRVDGGIAATDDNITEFINNRFAGNKRNGSLDRTNGQGGSDIKMYYATIQNITGSTMQLAPQSNYPSVEFTWGTGNTFGGVSPIPAACSNITALTTSCPVVNLADWFSKPRAVDDVYAVPVRQTINITDILANDFNQNNTQGINLAAGTETFSVITPPSNSNITIDAQGNITVGPNTPIGTHTIEYQVCGVQPQNGPTPTCSTATVYIEVYPDYDGDGVRDSKDLDNDNDGILDVNEGRCQTKILANNWVLSNGNKTATFTYPSGHKVVMTTTSTNPFRTENFTNENFWSDAAVQNSQGVFNDYSFPSTVTIKFFNPEGNPIKVRNPIIHVDKLGGENGANQSSAKIEIPSTDDYIWEFVKGTKDFYFSRKIVADGGAGAPKGTGTDAWEPKSTMEDLKGKAAGSAKIIGVSDTYTLNISNFELATSDNIGITISACFDRDTDGDGLPDYLDIDSDNDGCPDALEGGDSLSANQLVTAAGRVTDGNMPQLVTQNLCGSYDPATQNSPCVYSNGVPTLVNETTGQTVGASADANTSSCLDAKNDVNVTPENTPATGNVLTNDNALNVTPFSGQVSGIDKDGNVVANAGTLELLADGTYTFTPVNGFVGSVTHEYTANGVSNTTGKATLSIEVVKKAEETANPPVAVDDTAVTKSGVPVTVNVLANDSDVDAGDVLSVQSATGLDATGQPVTLTATAQDVYDATGNKAGTALLDASGNVVFTPEAGFTGDVPFKYTATDGTLNSGEANLTVTVIPETTSDFVHANDDSSVSKQGVTQMGNVVTNDNYLGTNGPINVTGATTADGTAITVATETTLASGGKLTINADGTYTYIPAAGFVGTESIVYTVCDAATPMSCDKATLYLTTLSNSVCTADPFTTGTDIETPIGISTLGHNTENWVTDKNAFIKLESNTLGFIPTKMTTAERDLLSGVVGMVIWNKTTKCLEIYTSNGWKCAKKGCNK